MAQKEGNFMFFNWGRSIHAVNSRWRDRGGHQGWVNHIRTSWVQYKVQIVRRWRGENRGSLGSLSGNRQLESKLALLSQATKESQAEARIAIRGYTPAACNQSCWLLLQRAPRVLAHHRSLCDKKTLLGFLPPWESPEGSRAAETRARG